MTVNTRSDLVYPSLTCVYLGRPKSCRIRNLRFNPALISNTNLDIKVNIVNMHPAIPTDIVSLKYQCTPLYLTPRMVRPDSISCTVLHTLLFPRPGQTAYRLAMRLGAFYGQPNVSSTFPRCAHLLQR